MEHRIRPSRNLLLLMPLLVAAITAPSRPANAARIQVSDEVWFDVHYLLQTRAALSPAADSSSLRAAFSVQNSRFLIRGRVAPRFGFLVGTGGDPNFGSFEVWDAVAFVDVSRALTFDAGLVLLPFVRHSQQFAGDMLTLDLSKTAFMYPAGSTNRRRDVGLRARGLLFDDRVDYRLAVTNGAKTEAGVPRVTGRVGLNVFEAEPGYIFRGTYLGQKRVLSFGLAFDLQPGVVAEGKSWHALGADAFWSIPAAGNHLTGQLALVRYRGLNARDPEGAPVVVDRSGVGAILDAGYAIGRIEPVVSGEWFRPQGAGGFDAHRAAAQVGVNWWIQGLAANLKLALGLVKEPGRSLLDAEPAATLQLQVRLP